VFGKSAAVLSANCNRRGIVSSKRSDARYFSQVDAVRHPFLSVLGGAREQRICTKPYALGRRLQELHSQINEATDAQDQQPSSQ
jgi:hypothetical protein